MKLTHLFLAISLAAANIPFMAQKPVPVPRPRLPQTDRPAPIISPEVHPDNTVTFRFRDPNAKEVLLSRAGLAKPMPMQKDDQGVWSVTAGPWEPDFYGYTFKADGVDLFDPSNWRRIPN